MKRIIFGMTVLASVCLFIACGSSDDDDNGSGNSNNNSVRLTAKVSGTLGEGYEIISASRADEGTSSGDAEAEGNIPVTEISCRSGKKKKSYSSQDHMTGGCCIEKKVSSSSSSFFSHRVWSTAGICPCPGQNRRYGTFHGPETQRRVLLCKRRNPSVWMMFATSATLSCGHSRPAPSSAF